MTQSGAEEPGGALRKAAQSFFPLETLSAPSCLLADTPLNRPPPFLLPSSLPTSVPPFSSTRISTPPPSRVVSSFALWASAPSISAAAGPCPALSASQALGAPPAPVSGRPPLCAQPGDLSAEPAGGSRPARRGSGY